MNHKKSYAIIAVFLAVSIVFLSLRVDPAQAAAPANDGFDQALVIGSLPYSDTQDLAEATTEWDDPWPMCWGAPQATIWYVYTPAVTRLLRINNVGGNSTIISAYTGSRGSLSQLACNGGTGMSLDLLATGGVTYYFMINKVGGYPYPAPGETYPSVFSIEELAPPANDDFANASSIADLPFEQTIDISAATPESNEQIPSCASWWSPSRTVWYVFTPGEDVTLIARSWGWMSTFWAVYTGSGPGSLTEVACRNWGDSGAFRAAAGATYYFQVGSMYGDGGWLTFHLEATPPPNIDYWYYPGDPSKYDTIQFQNYSGDPAGMLVAAAWDFGDGATSTDWNPVHRYTADGDYTVQLTVTTEDGRSATNSRVIQVRTHDVAITRFVVPQSATVRQTRQITVYINNKVYNETVEVQLLKSTPYGYVQVGILTLYVPYRPTNRAVPFAFSYTFTPEDAAMGKVTFKAVANLVGARDALPADNEVVSLPTKIGR
ncbi:MAG: PKD domain-containing protein [Omnitrophica WOR_2 bacterium]